jgi:molecular chaperone GrpE
VDEKEIKEEKNIKQEEKKKEKKPKVDKEKEELKNKNNELNDKVLRLSAEMQNMKRRYEEEISRIYKYDGEEVIKQLLTVVDNFERAILMDDEDLTDELSKFLSGFKMIYTNLVNILNTKGVSEIECQGKAFDPNQMQAVLTDKVEGMESGLVIEVLQKGYKYNEKVIRPAMVKVNE